eukprot:CAMPEP_0116994866 /NCGR_PEP_ID=MMETSP0467-20121206/68402_1 /TAXON_ID=283647 /ORGANISM="Mesodinium pulex, Strain SPMC105" /LENGTH=247 /DNA_ID=CAMNT_0004693049 /DNA_START=22 /DNA_END=766 /DNA_ORIENTATION=+
MSRSRSRSPDRGAARDAAPADDSCKLFIGNLSFETQVRDLEDAFSRYGKVVDARVMTDRDTGRPKGFGFVTFDSAASCEDAITGMNGFELQGREIRVDKALLVALARVPDASSVRVAAVVVALEATVLATTSSAATADTATLASSATAALEVVAAAATGPAMMTAPPEEATTTDVVATMTGVEGVTITAAAAAVMTIVVAVALPEEVMMIDAEAEMITAPLPEMRLATTMTAEVVVMLEARLPAKPK